MVIIKGSTEFFKGLTKSNLKEHKVINLMTGHI
ncbi:MAG: hypothetical protein JWN76_3081 [Chitinophagaceae bacterium]|nr:hypothetical protein [Chitinophagaceae bacterium]